MAQIEDIISAKELFGEKSDLVVQSANEVIFNLPSLGWLYQVATGVVALSFIFVLVRYYNQFRYLLLSFINKRGTKQSEMHIYAAEIRNIEIFMSIVGMSFLALFIMRLSVMMEMRPLLHALQILPIWGIGALFLVALSLTIALERCLLYLIGIVSEQSLFCNDIWHLKLLHFSTTITVLAPLLVLILLSDGLVAKISLYISVSLCFISLILFIKESFLLFRTQRFSIFHWILYLCALEIFPLSLLAAPIMRG